MVEPEALGLLFEVVVESRPFEAAVGIGVERDAKAVVKRSAPKTKAAPKKPARKKAVSRKAAPKKPARKKAARR